MCTTSSRFPSRAQRESSEPTRLSPDQTSEAHQAYLYRACYSEGGVYRYQANHVVEVATEHIEAVGESVCQRSVGLREDVVEGHATLYLLLALALLETR